MNTLKRTLVVPVMIALFAIVPAAALAHNGNDKEKGSGNNGSTQAFVQLQANGDVLVRGAEVTSVSGTTVVAETDHDGVTLRWTIEADNAELITYNGGSYSLNDIDDGDTVSFSGDLTGTLSVDADVLKEWSINTDTRVAITGTVRSIDDDDHSFVLADTRFGEVTVYTDSSTTFTGGRDSDFGDISSGERVAVTGTYSEDNDSLNATKVSLAFKFEARDFGNKVKGWFNSHFKFWKN